MTLCSTRNNYFGKYLPKGSLQNKKKIINPVLAKENPVSKSTPYTLAYNRQTILMPPVKKPLINKVNTRKLNFIKVSQHEEYLTYMIQCINFFVGQTSSRKASYI